MLKRIISLSLLVLVLFTTACSSGSTVIDFLGDDSDSESLGGITLYFNASFGPKDHSDVNDRTPYLGYTMNTTFADLAIARVAEVEKKLDVNIEKSNESTSLSNLIFLLAAGGGDLDAVIGMGYGEGSMSTLSKAFVPMSSVSQYIDIHDSAKWGAPERLEMFAWDGEIYGVIPNYWPELQFSSSDFIVVPNVTYIESLGETDPRDYFENGVWTLEKMEELIPRYAKYSEDKEAIIYGFAANQRHLYEMLMLYYEVDWAEKDATGNWVMGSLTANGRKAAEKLHEYWVGELSDLILFDNVNAHCGRWGNGQVAMSLLHSVMLTESTALIPQLEYEYAVLPFPSQDGKSVFGQFERNVEAIFIPSFTTYSDEAAKVLSAIYEPFEGYTSVESLKERYNTTLFFDERDTEVMFKLAESLRVLPASTLGEINITITDNLKNYDAATVLDRYSSMLTTLLEDELIPVKETMEKIFPDYNK